ncbi:uncharacterized protein I303_102515 [Kwoniella dejecticola CBS 10117]|uniref:Uncharacterized protein n=1 Tax=Kwoniella dejecticola CBS 10117 TaxID=1296121 RepID=A0A1A6A8Y6_9TREE|nr:uncharacterized protein I303_02529 [Kwoniella dejecticola CBS 10117]OBR86521.1 hypothetical protein I303_02529 [Kwoniella dejecticola CBS 10117]
MNLPSSEDAPGLFEEDQELLASVTAEDIQLVLDSVQQSSLPTNADSLATIPPPPAPPPAPPLSYPPIPFDPPFPSVPPQFSDMPLLFAYPALTPLAEQSKLSLAVNPFDQWNNLPYVIFAQRSFLFGTVR